MPSSANIVFKWWGQVVLTLNHIHISESVWVLGKDFFSLFESQTYNGFIWWSCSFQSNLFWANVGCGHDGNFSTKGLWASGETPNLLINTLRRLNPTKVLVCIQNDYSCAQYVVWNNAFHSLGSIVYRQPFWYEPWYPWICFRNVRDQSISEILSVH